jgi:Niemann-Pick C1 protein
MGYFGNSLKGVNEHNWSDKLNECASAPASCLPPFGSPLKPTMVLGGLKDSNDTTSTEVEASEAKAVIITFVVNNHLELEQLDQVKEWETTLKVYLEQVTAGKSYEIKDPRSLGMNMAWSTEISLESEINKSTNTDFPIVVLSYLAMFLYVAINLGGSGIVMLSAICRGFLALAKVLIRQVCRLPGNDPNSVFPAAHTRSTSLTRQLLVESKFSLALWSILIVLLSVSTSVGLFSLLGIKITLIIAEVIPFLVLAIGVDNVFILANEVSRQNSKAYTTLARGGLGFNGMEGLLVNEDEDDVEGLPSVETRIAMAVSRMGPSVLLSASCEALAFALGAIVGMPAVRNFAIYAAGAVIINTLLQMTVFVSAMSIDLHRMEVSLPFIGFTLLGRGKKKKKIDIDFSRKQLNKMDCLPCIHVSTSTSLSDLATASGEGDLARFFRAIYMPFLMKRKIKILVLSIFSGLFVFSALCSQRIVLGLGKEALRLIAMYNKARILLFF